MAMKHFRSAIAIVILFFTVGMDAIINGKPVQKHRYPFLANIMVNNENVHARFPDLIKMFRYPMICGGSILSDEWILTAAHCIVLPNAQIGEIFVSVGAHDFTDELKEGPRQYVKVSKMVHLGTFKAENNANDAILLKLEKKLNMSDEVQAAQIANKTHQAAECEFTIAGWGTTFKNRSYEGISKTPQQTKVKIADQKDCYASWSNILVNIDKSTICAGTKFEETAPCSFDSGSPLFYEEDGIAQIVGVVSFGGSAESCLTHKEFGAIGEVSSQRQNITDIIKSS